MFDDSPVTSLHGKPRSNEIWLASSLIKNENLKIGIGCVAISQKVTQSQIK